jgi:hypothetical protein
LLLAQYGGWESHLRGGKRRISNIEHGISNVEVKNELSWLTGQFFERVAEWMHEEIVAGLLVAAVSSLDSGSPQGDSGVAPAAALNERSE